MISWPHDAVEEARGRNGTPLLAFRLGIDLYDLATNGRTGWQVLLELDGTLNMFAPGDPRAFRTNLASYPPGPWTVLWDQTGQSLPFAVLRHQAGLFGAWLPLRDVARQPPPWQPTPQERMRYADQASRLQDQRHTTAMQMIRNIRP